MTNPTCRSASGWVVGSAGIATISAQPPGLDRAHLIRATQQVGGIAGRREDGLHRLHAVGDQQRKLHRVIAFAEIRAIGNLHA